jgi:hypothetical protein
LFLIQVLTALRAQAFAIWAACNLQWECQQDLLAQDVLEEQALALIIADLGFRIRDREFVASGIRPKRPIQQLELAVDVLLNRLQTAGTLQFNASRQTPFQAYVFDDLMLAVMLLNHLGVPRRFQRARLPSFAPEVNRIRRKFFLEINGVNFQFFDVEEHGENSAAIAPERPAGARQRGVSTARSKT